MQRSNLTKEIVKASQTATTGGRKFDGGSRFKA